MLNYWLQMNSNGRRGRHLYHISSSTTLQSVVFLQPWQRPEVREIVTSQKKHTAVQNLTREDGSRKLCSKKAWVAGMWGLRGGGPVQRRLWLRIGSWFWDNLASSQGLVASQLLTPTQQTHSKSTCQSMQPLFKAQCHILRGKKITLANGRKTSNPFIRLEIASILNTI